MKALQMNRPEAKKILDEYMDKIAGLYINLGAKTVSKRFEVSVIRQTIIDMIPPYITKEESLESCNILHYLNRGNPDIHNVRANRLKEINEKSQERKSIVLSIKEYMVFLLSKEKVLSVSEIYALLFNVSMFEAKDACRVIIQSIKTKHNL